MNDGKPYVSPPPDADGNYRYYRLGGGLPVRVERDERGLSYRAEAPDSKDGGALKVDLRLMARAMGSGDVEDISKQEFVDLCRRAADRSRP